MRQLPCPLGAWKAELGPMNERHRGWPLFTLRKELPKSYKDRLSHKVLSSVPKNCSGR